MNAITLGRMAPPLLDGFDRLRLVTHTLTLGATAQEQANWLRELIVTCEGLDDVLEELYGASDTADEELPEDLPRLVSQQWALPAEAGPA